MKLLIFRSFRTTQTIAVNPAFIESVEQAREGYDVIAIITMTSGQQHVVDDKEVTVIDTIKKVWQP